MPAVSYALFDLDQTLLPYDTQGLFCNYVLRQESWRRGYLAVFAPLLPLRAVRLVSTTRLKRTFLAYLWRMPRARLTELVHDFVETTLPPLFYPEIIAEVERHRAAGRTLILNTASPDFYAHAVARHLKFDHSIATRIRFTADPLPLIPELEGLNNKQHEKLKNMRHLFPVDFSLPMAGAWAYSDSRADLPMLRYVEHPVVVNPDPFLEKIAKEEQWPILRPARPQASRCAFGWDCARQALGLFS
jgi:HAD superfamily hydrolase (TIGR01490 family)